ncbi:MAG: chemotaxis response regulator protein-glutamate methylesterase [Acidobacteriota bacterium]|nr:chemotaxis response regulator protein-glutamate methylesterase [Acidobacteriota bacterium]
MAGVTPAATVKPTRVLVVDDSAIVRKLLTDALRGQPDIEVVGAASDPFMARDLILRHEPDVVTLDVEMPRMDGLTFLGRLMEHHPVPVIIVSSLTQSGSAASIEALRLGAVDVIPKPGGPYSVGQVTERLIQRIRGLRATPMRLTRAAAERPAGAGRAPAAAGSWRKLNGLILVGASTGGTQAIEGLLTRLPADTPPIAIVQHMPAAFTRAFADRLNGSCPMTVREAQGGEWLERGVAYIAPGDRHMVLEGAGLRVRTALKNGPLVQYQRPAVDVLFHSAARLHGAPMVALLLTGMGADGADGMVALRKAGVETIAEDEQSCVVFGMPKEAIARGGASQVATLWAMPSLIHAALSRPSAVSETTRPAAQTGAPQGPS